MRYRPLAKTVDCDMMDLSSLPVETRFRALECLEALARDKGLDGVSMRAVAKRLGISLAALQYHYPTKAELLSAFVNALVADHQQRLDAILERSPVHDRMGHVVRFTLEAALQQSEGGLLSMIEARAHHDAISAGVLAEFSHRYLSALADVVAQLHPSIGLQQARLTAVIIASLIDGATGYIALADSLGLKREVLIVEVVTSACQMVESMAKRAS